MKHPKVSIVLLNWNGFEDTAECIKSVHKSTYSNYDIFVVDNASKGNDVQLLRKEFGDKIKIIENERNYGWASVNIGINYIINSDKETKLILLLDNDTTVDKDFLRELVKCMYERDADIVSSLVYYYDNPDRLQYVGGKIYFWRDIILPLKIVFKDRVYGVGHDSGKYVEYIAFWCVLFRKEVFETIGLFDDSLFWGWEDIDFCSRVVQAGKRIVYAPKSKVWHKGRSTSRSDSSIHYYSTRNKFWIVKRFLPTWQYWCFIVYMFTAHLIFAFMYHLILKRRLRAFLNFVSGIIDGLLGKNKADSKNFRWHISS